MCATCGRDAAVVYEHHDQPREPPHQRRDEFLLRGPALAHHHEAEQFLPITSAARIVDLEHQVLAKNDRIAARTRMALRQRRVLALNILSGPGAGKTTLLERTIEALAPVGPVSVLEGDQETTRDTERVRAAGARATQINTGTGCHLDAAMVEAGLAELEPPDRSILFIENVGNLVCPALFDLGERAKVVLLSVTEGEDKPLKYPHIFRAARVLVLTKMDLSPHLDFDVELCLAHARQVNPRLRVFQLSARTGAGLGRWCDWIQSERALEDQL
jgi:hydrogenase nickel incorporation protein HypB